MRTIADVYFTGGLLIIRGGSLVCDGSVTASGYSKWLGGSLSGQGSFTNSGAFAFPEGNGPKQIQVTFNNTGQVQNLSGTLAFYGPLNDQRGTLDVQSGSVVLFGGGSFVDSTLRLTNGAKCQLGSTYGNDMIYALSGTIAISGDGDLELPNQLNRGQTLQIQEGGATITSDDGRLLWSSGVVTGPGKLTVDGKATIVSGKLKGGTIENKGAITQNEAYSLYMEDTAALNNAASGVYDFRDNGAILGTGTPGLKTVNNAGTFRKSGGSGTSNINSVTFNNTGTVEVLTGSMSFGEQANQTAGQIRLSGGSLCCPKGLNLEKGLLIGAGTITGNVTNSGGSIAPGGSSGVLTIAGSYAQGANGALKIELGGPAPENCDRLSVSASANLAGFVDVSLLEEYVPVSGQRFTILTAAARTGKFAGLSGSAAARFVVSYEGPEVVLTAKALGSMDFDGDGDVDTDDAVVFASCASGSMVAHAQTPACARCDADADGDVDQDDFGVFQRCYSGARAPADPNCVK